MIGVILYGGTGVECVLTIALPKISKIGLDVAVAACEDASYGREQSHIDCAMRADERSAEIIIAEVWV
jgi:hypothetical protein